MKITYDKEADAAYIYFREIEPDEVADTQGDWPIHVDISKDNEVLGIEVMDASKTLSQGFLEQAKD